MHLVFNERTKHIASWFNTLATALIAAGAFAPMAALLHGLSTPGRGIGYLLALVFGCVVGLALHLCGWAMLARLRE